jgi:nitroimidazol reductase NimA-like FMN-containing flavoprotein (pyridoxamine 5'-phosphate oxidase superfamily)
MSMAYPSTSPSTSFDELSVEECYALLPTVPLGRVVFTDRALPAIQPVNFVVDGAEVAFRTSESSRLAVAVNHAVVAFEVDSFDADARSGWSVVLVGKAYEVTDLIERDRILAIPLDSYAPSSHDRILKVSPSIVTGRRVGHAA